MNKTSRFTQLQKLGSTLKATLLFSVLKLLPKRLISSGFGKLAKTKVPRILLTKILQIYCRVYKVDLQELTKPVPEFATFHEFFTRQLPPGTRKIAQGVNTVVSPTDGVISACGLIQQQQLLQAKGIYYTLNELLAVKDLKNTAFAKQAVDYKDFIDGYFITLYLSPKDYHRIHSPISGQLKFCQRAGANLWPVNENAVKTVPALYVENERLISLVQTPKTQLLLVAVGAMIVGSIHWNFWDSSSTTKNSCSPNHEIEAGQELGYFELGSTVILLFPKGQFLPHQLSAGKRLKMGEELGQLTNA